MADTLRIIPLGGVGEVGKNITVIEAAGEILVVDCGLAFPDPEMLGIDLVIPDATYLAEKRDRVRGDHPHPRPRGPHRRRCRTSCREIPGTPIYATRLTEGLVQGKLREHKLLDSTPLHVVEPGREFAVGVVPDHARSGSATRSPTGSGTRSTRRSARSSTPATSSSTTRRPTAGAPTSGCIAEIGNRGVEFLLSDSTRAEKEGYTLSEATVGESLHRLVGEAHGPRDRGDLRQQHRPRPAGASTPPWAHGRKMVALGRSMEQNTAIALERGYLDDRDGTLVRKDQLQRLPKEELVVMTTGSQGEPMSGLTRMSNRDHRNITIEPGDTVIVSASPIPGNEEAVAKTIDNLFKEGAMVHYEPLVHCHVSGHGSREELKLMLGLVKPRHFIPVHGEYRMLVQHGLLAEGAGVDVDKIFVLENGQVVEYDGKRARMAGSVTAGAVLVDGIAAIDGIDGVVLRDRRMLASDGVVMVALTVDGARPASRSGQPDIVSRGFLSDPDDPLLGAGARAPAGGAPTAPRGRARGRGRLRQDEDPRHAEPLLPPAHEAPADDPADRDGGLSRVATRRRARARRRTTRRRRQQAPFVLSGRFVREALALVLRLPRHPERHRPLRARCRGDRPALARRALDHRWAGGSRSPRRCWPASR